MAAKFRVGLARGFLNAEGELAWGSIGVEPLEAASNVEVAFLPRPVRELEPADIGGWHGLILGGPGVNPPTLAEGAPDLTGVARARGRHHQIEGHALTQN